jgi:hypothetical protein
MKRKQVKKLLLENLYRNPDKTTKRMYIFGFKEGEIVKKFCSIDNCISEVENETTIGKQLIDLVLRYSKGIDKL